jgi:hypothetical protein
MKNYIGQSITTSTPKRLKLAFLVAEALDEIKQQAAKKIKELITARVVWETGICLKANEGLYALMAQCYQIEAEMSESGAEAKARREGLEEVASANGYRFKKNTKLMNKVVHCVLGDVQRNRVSKWAAALQEAKRQQLAVTDVAEFLKNNGGVEGVANKPSANSPTDAEKAEIAWDFLSPVTLATADGVALGQQFDAERIDRPCVLLATALADGSYNIKAVIDAASVVKAALKIVYGTNKESIKALDAINTEELVRNAQASPREAIIQQVLVEKAKLHQDYQLA